MSSPKPSRLLSLNEAVTFLAFGKSRTPEQELELHRVEQRKVSDLVTQCRTEPPGRPEFSTFQGRVPTGPLSVLREWLDDRRDNWPSSAATLYGLSSIWNEANSAGLRNISKVLIKFSASISGEQSKCAAG
jgi:hypothetical protein